jgi:hypothetical protein
MRVAGVLSLMAMAAPGLSSAATVAALQEGKVILWIDTDQKKVVGSVTLADGGMLVGMDVRPADGKLYGVTPDGAIVTVDAKTGAWQKVSQLSEALPTGVAIAVDFNPVADRLRIVAANGLSLRVTVQDGKAVVDGALKYAPTDGAMGKTPGVTAVAYTNSMAGAKETTLYDIDSMAGSLVRQAPPNDGVLATIGALGVNVDGQAAFDIWSDGMGTHVGWLLSAGRLHTVDLATGTAMAVGPIAGLKGRVTDIAILPAM